MIGKQTVLKKNAVPKLFYTDSNAAIDLVEPMNISNNAICGNANADCNDGNDGGIHEIAEKFNYPNMMEMNETCNVSCDMQSTNGANIRQIRFCDNCNILKAEDANLRKEYVELQTQNSILVTKLEQKIEQLEKKLQMQREQIQSLSKQKNKSDKTEKKLNAMLEDLKAREMSTQKVFSL